MTKTITIDVTAEDIAKGVRCKTNQCAVAQALIRMGYGADVSAYPSDLDGTLDITIYEGPGERPALTGIIEDKNIARKLTLWDFGAPLEPFSFAIELRYS